MRDETVCGSTPHGLSIKMRHRLKLSNEFSLNPNQKWRSRCGIRLHLLASSAKRKLSCPAMCCVVGCHNPISRRISEAQGPRPQRIAIVSYGAGGPEDGGLGTTRDMICGVVSTISRSQSSSVLPPFPPCSSSSSR